MHSSPSFLKQLIHPLLVTGFLFLAMPLQAKELQPEATFKETLAEILDTLATDHYQKLVIDDQLSSNILDLYLKELDSGRSYFFQSDIDEFEQSRFKIDDQLKAHKLDLGFNLYNRFSQRSKERIEFATRLLEDSSTPFDFTIDESLETDRSEADWISSSAEMDELWRKRVKAAVLNLKLADKTEQEAREILLKRYRNQLSRLEQANSEDVFQRYANAIGEQLDPHTQYFSPRSSENFKINMSLSLEGIGAVLQGDQEFTKVVRLVPAGPADKAGQLKPSDLILGVGQGSNGDIEDVVGWRLDDVVDLIRGPKDSTVRLQVRASDSENAPVRTISIVRNQVKLEEQSAHKRIIEVPYQDKTYKIGVIDIPAFYLDFSALQNGEKDYKSTTRDVEILLGELKQEGIDGLVVDLRNNGGGSLREANQLVGLFISRGPTVQIRDQKGRVDIMGDRDPSVSYEGPMAVLVNRLSASASEIFAGAIQDYQRGIIIGSQTFGKGTVQQIISLNHGQLKMTNAKFYRISGESTQHKGVMPDLEFPTLFDAKEIGESALSGALPWDIVRPVRHGYYLDFTPLLPELTNRHLTRTKDNPDFLFMKEQVEHVTQQRSKTVVSLKEDDIRKEREVNEKWQLEAENKRRKLKNQAPISTLSELDKLTNKDSQGRTIPPESEAMVEEAGYILLDMVSLSTQMTTASRP